MGILSVQVSRSVVSDSHARPPCPLPTPRVHLNPCPSSRWHHPSISSSVVPFSFCPQSFPASGSFQMSQLFALGSQNTGVSASTSVLPINSQDWSPLGWTGWISLQSKGLARVFSNMVNIFSRWWWLQSPSAVILEPRKIKSATVSTVSLSICHEVICGRMDCYVKKGKLLDSIYSMIPFMVKHF